jgi:hypothetical protein
MHQGRGTAACRPSSSGLKETEYPCRGSIFSRKTVVGGLTPSFAFPLFTGVPSNRPRSPETRIRIYSWYPRLPGPTLHKCKLRGTGKLLWEGANSAARRRQRNRPKGGGAYRSSLPTRPGNRNRVAARAAIARRRGRTTYEANRTFASCCSSNSANSSAAIRLPSSTVSFEKGLPVSRSYHSWPSRFPSMSP